MKKLLFAIMLCCLFLSSCSNKVYIYDNQKQDEYFQYFYEVINEESVKYVAVDFRIKEEYEESHIRQFQNFDISVGDNELLINWLKANYSKKTIVFIYTCDALDSNLIESLEQCYQKVYIYKGEYLEVRSEYDDLFNFDSGPYDCHC